MLTKDEIDLMVGYQEVYKKLFAESLASSDDVYPIFPKLGAEHMIQRMNPWDDIKGNCRHQLLLSLVLRNYHPKLIWQSQQLEFL